MKTPIWTPFATVACMLGLLFSGLTGCAVKSSSRVGDVALLNSVERVAVLPFEVSMPARANRAPTAPTVVGEAMADAVGAELLGRWRVIERVQLERLLDERELSTSGIVAGSEDWAGKISGVDALVLGSMTISRGFVDVFTGSEDYVQAASARLVDAETGEILVAVSFTASRAKTDIGGRVVSTGFAAKRIAEEMTKP